jgi:hypothetical protein
MGSQTGLLAELAWALLEIRQRRVTTVIPLGGRADNSRAVVVRGDQQGAVSRKIADFPRIVSR